VVRGTSHVGLSCESHVVNVRKAEEEAQSALDPEAFIRTMGNPASKVCPNPRCGRVFVRYRGHLCHSVTCGCGLVMCYNCLMTEPEINSAPHYCSVHTIYCSDICGCVECPTCATGKKCGDCDGNCPACRRGRPETPEEAAESQARRDVAAKEHSARYPSWPGSRRARNRATLVLPATIRLTSEGLMAARRVAERAAEEAERRATSGVVMVSGPLAGAASAVREGLELVSEAARDSAAGSSRVELLALRRLSLSL
jgi:hypothetical protein